VSRVDELPFLLRDEQFAREAQVGLTKAREWMAGHPEYIVRFGRAVRVQRRALLALAGEPEDGGTS
jgi:hypothetical protein